MIIDLPYTTHHNQGDHWAKWAATSSSLEAFRLTLIQSLTSQSTKPWAVQRL